MEAVSSCPAAAKRLTAADRLSEIRATSDWSYECRNLRGDGFLLLGDAAGFVDPIFSSGILMAMTSGDLAAQAVLRGLEHDDLSPRVFRGYERAVKRQIAAYRRLARRFYRPGFADVCLSPSRHFRLTPAVISLLAGCTNGGWPLRWRLALFNLVVLAQRFVPLAPRRVLHRLFERPSVADGNGAPENKP